MKVVIPDVVHHKFSNLCFQKWTKQGPVDFGRKEIMDEAIGDSYNRLGWLLTKLFDIVDSIASVLFQSSPSS